MTDMIPLPCHDRDIKIEFETRSLAQLQEHNGPDFVLIPEYVPMCLIESVLDLTRNGYNITIGEYHT